MKRFLSMTAILLATSAFLLGCSEEKTDDKMTDTKPKTEEKEQIKDEELDVKEVSAENVLEHFISSDIGVDQSITYTAQSDPNERLGRPGQYVGKINFTVSGIKIDDPESDDKFLVENGGSIEVFLNEEDAKKRSDTIKNLMDGVFVPIEYHYIKDNVLIRLSQKLTPDQAEKFNEALNNM